MELEEGQVVLCTVDKIIGTAVFVKTEYGGDGTIVTSEIAPGRIRNLRDYVVPNKKIVCKVLRVDSKGHADLSLRRVSSKEKKEVLEKHKKEKSLEAVLKTISKEPKKLIEQIEKDFLSLAEFFEKVKSSPEILNKLLSKEETEKLLKILSEKKEKEISVKKEFYLKNEESEGILKLKKILPPEATYLSAGKFVITIKDKDYKDANHKLNTLLQEIEQKAKQENCIFSLEKKK